MQSTETKKEIGKAEQEQSTKSATAELPKAVTPAKDKKRADKKSSSSDKKIKKKKKENPISKIIKSLKTSSESNTENAKEKKKFPLLAISTTVIATAMFMVIVASFMQMSQIHAEMKNMQATIRSLNAKERELSMELEGRYSSKIESIASDMGLSGKYHPTYYLEPDKTPKTDEANEKEDENGDSDEN